MKKVSNSDVISVNLDLYVADAYWNACQIYGISKKLILEGQRYHEIVSRA